MMKESSSLRHVSSAYTRDLDVVFEESEPPSAAMASYSDGLASLSFLRSTKTPAYPTNTVTRDVQVANGTRVPTSAGGPFRRARAGTMPSFVLSDEQLPPSSFLLSPPEVPVVGRHRSGSLNLPPLPAPSTSNPSYHHPAWRQTHHHHHLPPQQQPPSPSTEQLLQGDRDFAIARTLRSLGLEDDDKISRGSEGPPKRSLLSANRNRSYSVNAAAAYQQLQDEAEQQATHEPPMPPPYSNPLLSRPNGQPNRPRAASMGRMDLRNHHHRSILGGLWSSDQRLSPLVAVEDEDEPMSPYGRAKDLSLGDSELLANMVHKRMYDTIDTTPPSTSSLGVPIHVSEPFMQLSHSTPTFRDRHHQANATAGNGSPSMVGQSHSPPISQQQSSQQQQIQQAQQQMHQQQTATRSLWIGNIDSSITIDMLTQLFSVFGPIESVRLLLEKECAFVNFFRLEDAVHAKEEVLGHLGGRIGNCIVRIGYGKADAAAPDMNDIQPTRALWLGNIPSTVSPTTLQRVFSKFGMIESVRVLMHKNCGFVNFDQVDSAAAARDALLQNDPAVAGFHGARVGFAKVPPAKSASTTTMTGIVELTLGSSPSSKTRHLERTESPSAGGLATDGHSSWLNDLWSIMQTYGAEDDAIHLVKALRMSSSYHESIPHVPELGANRKFDAGRLRDLRKRLDNASAGTKDIEAIASECMEDIAELSSDYIGNTVVQRIFEKSGEATRTAIMERIAPHLASIGVHKNGTWAAQKIIDSVKLPTQITMIGKYLKPFVPPLLLDQFGNYAVQCCLRLGENNNQFIFDAMVEKLLNIAQGRFGARAMRTTLESQYITHSQKTLVAAALTQNAVSLATNANGALLLTWLMESSNLENRYRLLVTRLVNHLGTLCVHKHGSQMVLKLLDQDDDTSAQTLLLEALCDRHLLMSLLSDQVRGLSLVQKVLNVKPIASLPETDCLRVLTCELLAQLKGPGHEKLLGELAPDPASVYPSVLVCPARD